MRVLRYSRHFFDHEFIAEEDLFFLIFHKVVLMELDLTFAHGPPCNNFLNFAQKCLVIQLGFGVDLFVAAFVGASVVGHSVGVGLFLVWGFLGGWFLGVDLLQFLLVEVVGGLGEFLVDGVGYHAAA